MKISNKLWALILSLGLLLMTAPAFGADMPHVIKGLKNHGPAQHPYFFSVLGGSVIGMGVGALIGSGNDITKGLLVGGGGASTAYLLGNRRSGGAYRQWYMLAGGTALGTGIGWTVCGCGDGAALGAGIGFGAPAIYLASKPGRNRTAQTQQSTRP